MLPIQPAVVLCPIRSSPPPLPVSRDPRESCSLLCLRLLRPLQLVALLRDEYRRRGYEEVMSPLLFKRELWATSGHLQAYAENMFAVTPGIAPLEVVGAAAAAAAGVGRAVPAASAGGVHNGTAATATAAASTEGPTSADRHVDIAAAAHAHRHTAHQTGDHSHRNPSGTDEIKEGCCGDHANAAPVFAVVNAGSSSAGPGSAASEPAHPEHSAEVFGLKPMNCPGHCLMFKHVSRGSGRFACLAPDAAAGAAVGGARVAAWRFSAQLKHRPRARLLTAPGIDAGMLGSNVGSNTLQLRRCPTHPRASTPTPTPSSPLRPRVLQRSVSYKELPLRLADFSTLHRNEATGALGGLTRLRRFQQDDAHIFCSLAQVEAEVAGCLHFIAHVYRLFGFSFRAKLSTRPETYVGELATWQRAEAALATSLRQFLSAAPPQQQPGDADAAAASEHSHAVSGEQPVSAVAGTPAAVAAAAGADAAAPGLAAVEFEVDEGGGAFYGPKIDVFVRDAIGREHQCATVQLDFNLPQRFGLTYRDAEGGQTTPVMIHRAILGSVERMLGILIEHTAGRWPFWLSPRQVMVCSVNDRNVPYAEAVARELMAATAPDSGADRSDRGAGTAGPHGLYHPHASAESLFVDVDDSARTVPKKVREAQVAQYNVIAVVGDAEQAAGTVTLRFRDAATVSAFTACAAEVHVAVPAAAPAPAGERAASPTLKGSSKAAAVAAPKDADVPPATIITLTVAEAKRVCEHMSHTLR